jgi:hypothetical protein
MQGRDGGRREYQRGTFLGSLLRAEDWQGRLRHRRVLKGAIPETGGG